MMNVLNALSRSLHDLHDYPASHYYEAQEMVNAAIVLLCLAEYQSLRTQNMEDHLAG